MMLKREFFNDFQEKMDSKVRCQIFALVHLNFNIVTQTKTKNKKYVEHQGGPIFLGVNVDKTKST